MNIFKCIAMKILLFLALQAPGALAGVSSQGIMVIPSWEATKSVKTLIVGNQRTSWNSGFWALQRPEKKGSLGIEVIHFDASNYGGEALLIEQGLLGLQRIRVWRCASGNCEIQKVEQKSPSEFEVIFGSLQLKIRDYGEACEAGKGECRYFLPSWAIKSMAKNSVDGIPRFPKMLVIRQALDELQFYNGENGKLFHELVFEKGYLDQNLGLLQQGTINETGQMSLDFEKGAMLIDWAQDLILVGDDKGRLWLHEGGTGSLKISDFKNVYTPLAQKTLAIGGRYVVHHRQVLIYHLNYFSPFKIIETVSSSREYDNARVIDDEKAAMVSIAMDGETSLSFLNVAEQQKISERFSYPKAVFAGRKILFTGDNFFGQLGEEWMILGKKGEWELLKFAQKTPQFQVAGSSYFSLRPAPTDGSRAECEWTRFPIADSLISREDSFLRVVCDATFEAGYGRDGSVIALGYHEEKLSHGTGASGDLKIHWKIWWP